MLPLYTKIFNVISDTGIIPENWTIGQVKPIYKHKGNPKSPENYRPISLLSCFEKVFTSILNKSLNTHAEKYDVINACQVGFRNNHSTVHTFISLFY